MKGQFCFGHSKFEMPVDTKAKIAKNKLHNRGRLQEKSKRERTIWLCTLKPMISRLHFRITEPESLGVGTRHQYL